MSDLVERLLECGKGFEGYPSGSKQALLYKEAADKIERLQSVVDFKMDTISTIIREKADEIERLRAEVKRYCDKAVEGWTRFYKAEAEIERLTAARAELEQDHE